jgi:hypothetical protein
MNCLISVYNLDFISAFVYSIQYYLFLVIVFHIQESDFRAIIALLFLKSIHEKLKLGNRQQEGHDGPYIPHLICEALN